MLQRRLADLLVDCIKEIDHQYGRDGRVSRRDNVSHAFRKYRSILTNAKVHKRKRYVLNVDLKDFFGSINFGRVRGYFISNKHFNLSPNVATVLAQIACRDGVLPQGSPCSPILSHMIGNIVDKRIIKLARKCKCAYTRYADDLTFSTNLRGFPEDIACMNEGVWEVGKALESIIESTGFSINNKKTRMQYSNSRQDVTGLVVNEKVNVKSEYRHTVRAMVHKLFTTGEYYIKQSIVENGKNKVVECKGTLKQMHGMLGFIDGVDIYNNKLSHEWGHGNSQLSSKELMYRRFLIYKEFYAADSPIVVCEGKTDNVYLTHAIRSLAKNYPHLAEVFDDLVQIKIRRFKYKNNSTGRVLGLKGGTNNLSKFIHTYKNETSRFTAPSVMRNPVIILIDNDEGTKSIYPAVKSITGKKPDPNYPYTHVYKNLYLVVTPCLENGDGSAIEDFFDSDVKNIELDRRKFSTSNNYDKSTHYGKAEFAYKVIEKNANKINFKGFSVVLDRLTSVIVDHAAAVASREEKE